MSIIMPFDGTTWALLGASILASVLLAYMYVTLSGEQGGALPIAVMAMYLEQAMEAVPRAG